MSRPTKKVDEKLLEKLSYIHLPDVYIAHCLGISKDTLHRRYADKIEHYKSQGKAKLLSKAWAKVESGDWNAIKFLLQNYLKMSDKVENTINDESKGFFTLNYSDAKLKDEPQDR